MAHAVEQVAQGLRVARHLEADVKALRHTEFLLRRSDGFPGDVHGAGRAQPGGELQSIRVDVGNHHVARPGMTEERFNMILSKQLPDKEKRERADYIIPSDTLEGARAAVQDTMKDILDRLHA